MIRILLNKTTFPLAVLLLGSSVTTSGWTMDSPVERTLTAQPRTVALQAIDINTFEEFFEKSKSTLPSGALFLLNVGHGLVQSCTSIREEKIENPLRENHSKFLEAVKSINEVDYNNLTKKVRLASGDELVKLIEKGLPKQLDILSASGVYIIPISSRGDDGKSNSEGKSEILSRTEKEFRALSYDWENWAKPTPLKNLTTAVTLQDINPAEHGTYQLRNGIIYSATGNKPHKSAAIVGLIQKLKEENSLPSAIYFSDRASILKETIEDLKAVDLGLPLYLLNYTQPLPFRTIEDLEEFYVHRLGQAKFADYQFLFKEIFKQP